MNQSVDAAIRMDELEERAAIRVDELEREVEQLSKMIVDIGARERDGGCGCCSGNDRCRWCDAEYTSEVKDDKYGYQVIHKESCPWLSQMFGVRVEWERF